MKKFLGREAESRVIQESYHGPHSGFIPVYGRRRVGKSELILHEAQELPALYFLGKQAPAMLQIREFLREAGRAFDQPLLGDLAITDWRTAFLKVLEQAPKDKKIVLALDEFQWMAKSSPELPSILQELWDRHWRDSGKMLLILCGSYMGFMEKEVLGHKSPLFGRRTAQIFLQPFSYGDAALFFPGWSEDDCARAYFICGGIPFYMQLFSGRLSIAQNIEANILNEFAPMYSEPEFLLREELKELEKYYGILMALSSGSRTPAQIAAHTGTPEKSLHYYLQNLTGLRYVGKTFPLSGRKTAPRNVRFEVTDPLLRFWFRFVYPNRTAISRMPAEQAFQNLIAPNLASYFGLCFERLCREALPMMYAREHMHAGFEVGAYWDKAVQIDLVGLRDDHRTDICECKWGEIFSVPALIEELKAKMKKFPNPENATLQGKIFTRRPIQVERLPEHVIVHDLKELYTQT